MKRPARKPEHGYEKETSRGKLNLFSQQNKTTSKGPIMFK